MVTYKPRGDFVLFRVITIDKTDGGVALPDVSPEGKSNYVLAVGENVKDLNPGDRILVIGVLGQDVVHLPREKSMMLTKSANVMLTVEGAPTPPEITELLRKYGVKS